MNLIRSTFSTKFAVKIEFSLWGHILPQLPLQQGKGWEYGSSREIRLQLFTLLRSQGPTSSVQEHYPLLPFPLPLHQNCIKISLPAVAVPDASGVLICSERCDLFDKSSTNWIKKLSRIDHRTETHIHPERYSIFLENCHTNTNEVLFPAGRGDKESGKIRKWKVCTAMVKKEMTQLEGQFNFRAVFPSFC